MSWGPHTTLVPDSESRRIAILDPPPGRTLCGRHRRTVTSTNNQGPRSARPRYTKTRYPTNPAANTITGITNGPKTLMIVSIRSIISASRSQRINFHRQLAETTREDSHSYRQVTVRVLGYFHPHRRQTHSRFERPARTHQTSTTVRTTVCNQHA